MEQIRYVGVHKSRRVELWKADWYPGGSSLGIRYRRRLDGVLEDVDI